MRRAGWMLGIVAALGCVSTTRTPVVAVPEPCACPARRGDSESVMVTAAFTSGPTMSPEALDAVHRDRAVALVVTNTDASLDDEGLLTEGQHQFGALDPTVVTNEASIAFVGPEQDILRAMHELHALWQHDDAMPAAERKVLFWQRFETEVETFRSTATEAVATRLANVLLDRTAIAWIVTKVSKWVTKDFAPTDDHRLAFARDRARRKLVELTTPTAGKLADGMVEKRRGQWLAVLHGKT